MIRIVCVLKSGGVYTSHHVRALREGCAKHMPSHEFVCFTDVGLADIIGCRVVPLQHPEWRGWWAKMEIFGPILDDVPTLFLDLDTILVGRCHELVQAAEGRLFVILRDFHRGKTNRLAMGSAAMYWHHRPPGLYEAFCADASGYMARLRGDQEFLEEFIKNAAYWQDLTSGFATFKSDVMHRGVLPTDRIILFSSWRRPWQQTLLPYPNNSVHGDAASRDDSAIPTERPLRIACVLKSGGEYKPEHVRALKEGCAKYMPHHEFVCFTDMDLDIPDCRSVPLQHPEWRGWWAKMEVFGPTLDDVPTLFLDLDTILVGPCHDILGVAAGRPFVILRDVFRGRTNKRAMQSSAMYWHRRPHGLYEVFRANAVGIMGRLRGDQDYLEEIIKDAAYWQDLTLGFASYKADVVRRGVLPKDRIIIFHGPPRPWRQTLLPYAGSMIQPDLVLRNGWVVPGSDVICLPAVLGQIQNFNAMVLRCSRRRTAIQAGGNVGICPAHLAKAFKRCITFEPDALNFEALKINTGDLGNIEWHHAALGAREGRASLCRRSDNVGAHYLRPGKEVRVTTIDLLGINDCDLLQLDVEGSEYEVLMGAQETIRRSRPVIALELNGLGKRYGHSNEETIHLLKSWGYKETERRKSDVIFQHCESIKDRATQLANMPAYPPVQPDESCLLVGNGPSVLSCGNGAVVDRFDQVVRFNNFKLRGFEDKAGTKTTLWATFGRGQTPSDPDVVPERILYIHDHKGDPAFMARELWRIPTDFYWEIMKPFEGQKARAGTMLLPSSGYLVASWLLHTGVRKLSLLGFDHFSKEKSGLHHYWVNKRYIKPKEHDGDMEASLFRGLMEQGRIEYL